jgi:hypothetical protein
MCRREGLGWIAKSKRRETTEDRGRRRRRRRRREREAQGAVSDEGQSTTYKA